MSVNKVILIGDLEDSPEIRYTQEGFCLASFHLLTKDFWVDKAGQKQERTEKHKILLTGKDAEHCQQHIVQQNPHKLRVSVEGSIQTQSWQTPEGQTRYSTEIKARQVKFFEKNPQEPSDQALFTNQAICIGHLGQNPDMRHMPSGQPVTNLTVASNDVFLNSQGQREDRTEWHRVVVWSKQAENCQKYLLKGHLVYIEGTLRNREWQDKEGQNRNTTEITANRVVFLTPKGQKQEQQTRPQNYAATNTGFMESGSHFPEEDLPF